MVVFYFQPQMGGYNTLRRSDFVSGILATHFWIKLKRVS